MDGQAQMSRLNEMLSIAKTMPAESEPIIQEAIPRLVAILTDAIRLMDVDYQAARNVRGAP